MNYLAKNMLLVGLASFSFFLYTTENTSGSIEDILSHYALDMASSSYPENTSAHLPTLLLKTLNNETNSDFVLIDRSSNTRFTLPANTTITLNLTINDEQECTPGEAYENARFILFNQATEEEGYMNFSIARKNCIHGFIVFPTFSLGKVTGYPIQDTNIPLELALEILESSMHFSIINQSNNS